MNDIANARRRTCALLLLVTLPLGLVWRLAPLHLSQFAFKYGGSALWAAAVYWLLGLLRPIWRPPTLAGAAVVVSTAVEFLKRLYWPPLDHFRETMAGKLLLGRYFTYGAIVAYWLAIALAAYFDNLLLREAARGAVHTPIDTAN